MRLLVAICLLLVACDFQVAEISRAESDAPDMAPPRLIRRGDTDGKMKVWDRQADAACEKQPLCDRCASPMTNNPMYCVPIGDFDGKPTGLGPFALGDWFADPFCSVHLYGLSNNTSNAGATPGWAYQFDEVRLRAKVYKIALAPADLPRPWKMDLYDASMPCQRVTDSDLSAAARNVTLYIQTEPTEPADWATWDEAQHVLDGALP